MRLLLLFVTALSLQAQMSLEKEVALGAHLAESIRGTNPPLENLALQQYVDRIGRLLSAQFPNFPFTWTFAVVADDFPGHPTEPLAIPGGYIFVPLPRMLAAADEAAFARTMAHAMAQVSERHGMPKNPPEPGRPLIYHGPYGRPGAPSPYETEAEAVATKVTSGIGFDPSSAELRRLQNELRPPPETRVPRKPPTLLRPNETRR